MFDIRAYFKRSPSIGKLQKETEEEAKRLEIDRKEAKYQEKFRLDTIARAENLLYQETAATRALRSRSVIEQSTFSHTGKLCPA